MKTSFLRPRRPLLVRMLLAAFLLATPGFVLAAAAPSAAPAGEAKAAAPITTKPHVLASTEQINVAVEGETELIRTVTIDEKGTVNLGLIQSIKLAGLTVEQACRSIEKAYIDGRFLRRPKVSITVERPVVHTVTVFGQFKKTGKIVIPTDQDIDIMDVVVLADGFTEVAKESAVKVTRILDDGSQKSWDNIDVGSLIKGKKDRKDALVILPNDIITVPMRAF